MIKETWEVKSKRITDVVKNKDWLIWLLWGRYWYIGHSWTDSQYRYPIFPKFLNLVFCFIIKNMIYSMPYVFSITLKIRIYELKFFKLQQFQYLLWFLINLINDRAFVLTATCGSWCMSACLWKHTALLQDNCLDLAHYAFLLKLSGCVRNITVVCQHLLRPIVLADTDISVKPKYQSDYISQPISTKKQWKWPALITKLAKNFPRGKFIIKINLNTSM